MLFFFRVRPSFRLSRIVALFFTLIEIAKHGVLHFFLTVFLFYRPCSHCNVSLFLGPTIRISSPILFFAITIDANRKSKAISYICYTLFNALLSF